LKGLPVTELHISWLEIIGLLGILKLCFFQVSIRKGSIP